MLRRCGLKLGLASLAAACVLHHSTRTTDCKTRQNARFFVPSLKIPFNVNVAELSLAVGRYMTLPACQFGSVGELLHLLQIPRAWRNFDTPHRTFLPIDTLDDVQYTLTSATRVAQALGKRSEDSYIRQLVDGCVYIPVTGVDCPIGELGEPHFGHFVATFGMAGINSSCILTASTGRKFELRDLVRGLCSRYSSESEPEFFSLALIFYMNPPFAWRSAEGQAFSLDSVASQMASSPVGYGACDGTHVLYSLALMLRLNNEYQFLEPSTEQKVILFLRNAVKKLVKNELPEGGWGDWVRGRESIQDPQILRMNTTSHHLEWLTYASPDVVAPSSIVNRAVLALERDLMAVRNAPKYESRVFLAVSHAIKAIAGLSN